MKELQMEHALQHKFIKICAVCNVSNMAAQPPMIVALLLFFSIISLIPA